MAIGSLRNEADGLDAEIEATAVEDLSVDRGTRRVNINVDVEDQI